MPAEWWQTNSNMSGIVTGLQQTQRHSSENEKANIKFTSDDALMALLPLLNHSKLWVLCNK